MLVKKIIGLLGKSALRGFPGIQGFIAEVKEIKKRHKEEFAAVSPGGPIPKMGIFSILLKINWVVIILELAVVYLVMKAAKGEISIEVLNSLIEILKGFIPA